MRIIRDTNCEKGEIPTVDNIEQYTAIAPGEGRKPISIFKNVYCEEKAHPQFLPTSK